MRIATALATFALCGVSGRRVRLGSVYGKFFSLLTGNCGLLFPFHLSWVSRL